MRTALPIVIVAALAAATYADTPTTGGGGGIVRHDTSLTGSGTTSSNLGIRTCSADEILYYHSSAWTCVDPATFSTAYTAGSGLTLLTGVFAIDPTYTQRRVSSTCSAPDAIRAIAQDGTVTCTSGTGDITDVIAGSGLTGGATSGAATVDVGAGTNITVNANDVALATNVAIGGTLSVLSGATTVSDFRGSSITATTSGTLNDWAPTGLGGATVIRVSTSGNTTINGITGGASGRVLVLHNVGSQLLIIANEAGGSTAANRIVNGNGATFTLQSGQSVALAYDSTDSRWRTFASPDTDTNTTYSAGTGLSLGGTTFSANLAGASCSAGSFMSALSAAGSGTCTAETGDISSVTAGTNMNGGGTSGAVTLNLNNAISLSGTANTHTIFATNTATGQTSTVDGVNASVNGSFNTTAGALVAIGNLGTSTSTRSAGANPLSNYGIYGFASSGQFNMGANVSADGGSANPAYGVYAGAANGVGGNFSFYGWGGVLENVGGIVGDSTLSVLGNTTLGDASTDVVDINGDLTKFTTTNGDGGVYIDQWGLMFGYSSNSVVTGYINYNGYLDSTGQYRNLIVADGQHSTILTITGSTKAAQFDGALASIGDFSVNTNKFTVAAATGNTEIAGTLDVAGQVSMDGLLNARGDFAAAKKWRDTGLQYGTTSCGTSPTRVGGATHGRVTIGSTGTGCIITFGDSVSLTNPSCTVTTSGATKTFTYSVSSTTLTLSSATAAQVYDFNCIGT